jgi:hypothetical protein
MASRFGRRRLNRVVGPLENTMQSAVSLRKSPARWIATVLLLSCAAIAAVSCADDQNTIPISAIATTNGEPVSRAAKATKPEIVFLGQRIESHGNSTYVVADLVFVNPLEVPVTYPGYRMDSWQTRPKKGEISPLYRLRVQHDGDRDMKDKFVGWCGTGADKMIVRPKEAGRFNARIAMPVKSAEIGFSCTWSVNGTRKTTEIWSPTINTAPQ